MAQQTYLIKLSVLGTPLDGQRWHDAADPESSAADPIEPIELAVILYDLADIECAIRLARSVVEASVYVPGYGFARQGQIEEAKRHGVLCRPTSVYVTEARQIVWMSQLQGVGRIQQLLILDGPLTLAPRTA